MASENIEMLFTRVGEGVPVINLIPYQDSNGHGKCAVLSCYLSTYDILLMESLLRFISTVFDSRQGWFTKALGSRCISTCSTWTHLMFHLLTTQRSKGVCSSEAERSIAELFFLHPEWTGCLATTFVWSQQEYLGSYFGEPERFPIMPASIW